MSESFPLVMTFPDRKGGYPKPGGAFHLVSADAFLRTSHEAFANLKTFHSYRLTSLPGDVIQATPFERVEPAHTTRARSAMRLFQYPNLRRFVPAA